MTLECVAFIQNYGIVLDKLLLLMYTEDLSSLFGAFIV